MSRPTLGLTQRTSLDIGHEQLQKLIGRLQLAHFMELPETDFRSLLREVENDPLFKRFLYPARPEERIISCRRFPRGDLSRRCFELQEHLHLPSTTGTANPVVMLDRHRGALEIIRRIGMDAFRRYFLYVEEQLAIPELARRTGLTEEETRTVIELMDEVFMHTETVHGLSTATTTAVRYTCVASLEKIDERFVVGFHHPSYVRGRYTIHYDRIKQLEASGALTREERRRLSALIKKLELLNARKHLLYQILEVAIEIQETYLRSGNPKELKPFLLKDLAARIGVDNSLVTRCIQDKSVETPWGEKPIRFFFPNRKEIAKQFVAEIIEQEQDALSDEQIRELLRERYHIEVSRRSVNAYRASMRIASSYRRAIPSETGDTLESAG